MSSDFSACISESFISTFFRDAIVANCALSETSDSFSNLQIVLFAVSNSADESENEITFHVVRKDYGRNLEDEIDEIIFNTLMKL